MQNKLNNIGKEKITLANFEKSSLKDLKGIYVYQVINIKNGKRKICETGRLIEHISGFLEDPKDSRRRFLQPDIDIQPLEDFEISILGEYPNKKEAKAAKKHFIAEFDATNPEKGYNINKN